eukprot:gb/GEZN01005460.1/.p1 GENE.gb/GEZN01005460.1/~~gb/GEZN01005460.1/.p1  ORF type:complete len:387 (-),score=30.92 gb/GEZN01005460.1/:527-1687(-)
MDHYSTISMGSRVALDSHSPMSMDCPYPTKARSSSHHSSGMSKHFNQQYALQADVTFWKEHTTPTMASSNVTQAIIPSLPASTSTRLAPLVVTGPSSSLQLSQNHVMDSAYMAALDPSSEASLRQAVCQNSTSADTEAMLNLLAATAHPTVLGAEGRGQTSTNGQQSGAPMMIPSYILASMASQPEPTVLQKLSSLGAMQKNLGTGLTPSTKSSKRLGRRAISKKVRPFLCLWPGCGERFPTHYSLKRHFKRHSGDRPHACTVEGCNGRFAEKSTLQRHLQMHNGERPFRCKFKDCGRRYADRLTCQRHEDNYHSGESEGSSRVHRGDSSNDSQASNDSQCSDSTINDMSSPNDSSPSPPSSSGDNSPSEGPDCCASPTEMVMHDR